MYYNPGILDEVLQLEHTFNKLNHMVLQDGSESYFQGFFVGALMTLFSLICQKHTKSGFS